MGTPLSVVLHPADQQGCGHYRLIWPGEEVARQYGDMMTVRIVEQGDLRAQIAEFPDRPNEVVGVEPLDADVLVLQRPLNRLIADCIPFIQANGTAVVVELDDDFTSIHRNNTVWADVQPNLNPDRNWKHLQRACRLADIVTVTTPKLAAKYGTADNARVIPNYMPAHAVAGKSLKPPRGKTRFTWTGSIATHPTDLQQATAGVQTMAREGWGELWVVGTGVGVAPRIGLGPDKVQVSHENEDGDIVTMTEDNPLVHHTEGWVPLLDYPTTVASYTDVGLVPLDSIPFNEAKSWLKGLEFAAAGRPFIASDTGPYRQLHEEYGLGLIAKKPRDWTKLMRRLAESPQMAAELGAHHLAVVAEKLTIEAHAGTWAAVWTEAVVRHRANTWPGYTCSADIKAAINAELQAGSQDLVKASGFVPFSEEMALGG